MDQLRTLRELAQAEDGHHAGQRLQQDELVRIAQADAAEQHRDHRGHEGRARVEEDAQDDGQHGVGQYVDIEYMVGHHQGGDDAEGNDDGKEQQQATATAIILGSENVEIEHEAEDVEADEEQLSAQHEALLPESFATLDRLAAQALQDVVGLRGDNLASVDNLLSAEYQSVGPRVAAQHLVAGSGGALLVVDEVGVEILVEGTLLQDVGAVVQGVGMEQVVVGLLHGVEVGERLLAGHLVADDADGGNAVCAQLRQGLGGQDTRPIDLGELPFDVAQVVGRGQDGPQALREVVAQTAQHILLHLLV